MLRLGKELIIIPIQVVSRTAETINVQSQWFFPNVIRSNLGRKSSWKQFIVLQGHWYGFSPTVSERTYICMKDWNFGLRDFFFSEHVAIHWVENLSTAAITINCVFARDFVKHIRFHGNDTRCGIYWIMSNVSDNRYAKRIPVLSRINFSE